jgi:transcriptional regulator with XRE-family HTH domain
MSYKPFGKVLGRLLEKREVGLRDFARRVGLPSSFISRVKQGQSVVPTARIEAWADVLELSGQERTEFIDAAYWSAVPERVRPWVESKITSAKRTS